MKKTIVLSAAVCFTAVMLLVMAGCSISGKRSADESPKSYPEIMNERLVSFTDCADAFSRSLEAIAESESAPSDVQIADMQKALDGLERACAGLAGQDAPTEYAHAQQELDKAMGEYAAAIEKCRALLAFFQGYDDAFHQYKDPQEGSAKMEKKERALYDDFAQAMQTASESFRSACETFGNVR